MTAVQLTPISKHQRCAYCHGELLANEQTCGCGGSHEECVALFGSCPACRPSPARAVAVKLDPLEAIQVGEADQLRVRQAVDAYARAASARIERRTERARTIVFVAVLLVTLATQLVWLMLNRL